MSIMLRVVCLVALLCVSSSFAYQYPVNPQHQDTARMGASLAQLVAHLRHSPPQHAMPVAHAVAAPSPKEVGHTTMNDGPCVADIAGRQWDLSSMTGLDLLYKQANQAYDFSLAICGTSSHLCGPVQSPVHSSLCQHHGHWSYSLITSWENPAWNLLDHSDPRKGIQASFHNGDAIGCGRNRLTTVQFVCDASVSKAEIRSVSEPSRCNYVVSIHSPDVCHGGSNHLSHASSFIVILLTGFLLYCIVGVAYKRTKLGVTDWKESIPNVDFWVEVPGLIKDGVMWSKDKAVSMYQSYSASSGSASSEAKYEPVPSAAP